MNVVRSLDHLPKDAEKPEVAEMDGLKKVGSLSKVEVLLSFQERFRPPSDTYYIVYEVLLGLPAVVSQYRQNDQICESRWSSEHFLFNPFYICAKQA